MAKRPDTTKAKHAASFGRRGFVFSGASVAFATTVIFDPDHIAPDPHVEGWRKLLKIQTAWAEPVAPEAEERRNARLVDKEDRILAWMAATPVTSFAGARALLFAFQRFEMLPIAKTLFSHAMDYLAGLA